MLIPIIKESEKEFEKRFPFWKVGQACMQEPTDESQDVKNFLHSSQLALLEGLKKYLQRKIRHEHGDTEEDFIMQDAKNQLIEDFIESLEESITYLKSMK